MTGAGHWVVGAFQEGRVRRLRRAALAAEGNQGDRVRRLRLRHQPDVEEPRPGLGVHQGAGRPRDAEAVGRHRRSNPALRTVAESRIVPQPPPEHAELVLRHDRVRKPVAAPTIFNVLEPAVMRAMDEMLSGTDPSRSAAVGRRRSDGGLRRRVGGSPGGPRTDLSTMTVITRPPVMSATRRLQRHEAATGYAFVLPSVVGFLVFVLGPLVAAFVIELHQVRHRHVTRMGRARRTTADMWRDGRLRETYVNTVIYVICAVVLINVVGLALAVMVNRRLPGWAWTVLRSVVLLPVAGRARCTCRSSGRRCSRRTPAS